MNLRNIILSIALIGWLNSYGQISPERTALKNLTKHKWEKVSGQMKKAIRKDSLNTAAPFVMAQYFFTPANPNFQVDSAYAYIMVAMSNYQQSTVRLRDKLRKFPIDSTILVHYRERIDSAAFTRAKELNTVSAYDFFLRAFPLAQEQNEAILLRHEVAYEDVLKLNTYPDFKRYMEMYPDSKRFGEAKRNYERLLYRDKTQDQKLASYTNFLKDYPETPYRKEIEKSIFEIAVASGSIESFQDYLQRYPQSPHVSRAKAILFYLLKAEQRLTSIQLYESDSVNQVLELEQKYLVPFLHQGTFGFMDEDGMEVLKTTADEVNPEYLCGNVLEDVLVLPHGIVARNGIQITKGKIISAEDIGMGFLLLEQDSGMQVIHKSGFTVGDDSVEDARILQDRLLALKKNNLWSVWSLSGLRLYDYMLDDITEVSSKILLWQKGKCTLTSTDALASLADREPLRFSGPYDEVKAWEGGLLWCRSEDKQGLLDNDLNIYIPLEKQLLSNTFCGITSRQQTQVMVFDNGSISGTYEDVIINKPWAVFRSDGKWRLNRPLEKYKPTAFDSVYFVGPFAVGVSHDTLFVHFNAAKRSVIKLPARLGFIPGQDSSVYLLLDQAEKKTVFDQKGKKLFTVAYDKIQYGGNATFIVSVKEKKGLINSQGKILLAVEYDAIGTVKEDVISLLKSMKFGVYNIRTRKLIKPEYAKNLIPYNKQSVVAYKSGKYGFINWAGKPLSDFIFSEVQPWTDSVAFVKKDFMWLLYEIGSKRIVQDKIKDFKLIQDSPSGKLAIVHQDNQYGVLHSKRGYVIPATFSDIVNVGSSEVPMYFTEKHVEEASIFVVIYYNHEGKMIRKEVYEHDDYDKIYCSGGK